VPARGLEPRTLGLKLRPDLRMTRPQAPAVFDSLPRASSRLLQQPRLGYTNWLYIEGLERSAGARERETEGSLPTSLRRATASGGVRGFKSAATHHGFQIATGRDERRPPRVDWATIKAGVTFQNCRKTAGALLDPGRVIERLAQLLHPGCPPTGWIKRSAKDPCLFGDFAGPDLDDAHRVPGHSVWVLGLPK